ncbi:hypothetical protein WDU94_011474 [Cyamophila willieti]
MQSLEAADETENTFNLYEEFSKFNSCGVSGDAALSSAHEDLDAALFEIHNSGLLESVDSFVPAAVQSNGHEIKVEQPRVDCVKQELEEDERVLADLGLKQDGSTQLGKLVRQQNLNYVTLTIHSETQFSIQLPNRAEVMFPLTSETHEQFLTSISSNKIPTILYDYILTCSMAEQLFYSGCLIVYVQNLTRSLSCSSKYFTLLGRDYSHHFKDLNHIRASLPVRKDWSCKSLNHLESQLLNPPSTSLNSTKLNLDVREPCGYEKLIRDHRSRLAFAKPSIRRCLRQATQSLHRQRKQKLSEYGEQVARMNYLYEMCKKNQKSEQSDVAKTNRGSSAATKSEKREPDTEQEKLLAFKFGVSQIGRLSKRYERPPDTNDWYPRLVEEYILEAERGESRVYNKVSVSRRPTNGEFLGQMYVDHEYKEDGASQSGASYKFTLGSRRQTNRYIHQFIEIFTEKGCKSVQLTHLVAGQPAKVSCTKAMQEKQQQQQAAAQQQQRKPVLQVLNSQQLPQQFQPQPSTQQASTLKTLVQSPVTPQPRTVLQQQLCTPSVSSQQQLSNSALSQQLAGASSQQLNSSALSQQLSSPSVSNQQLNSSPLSQQLSNSALSQQLSAASSQQLNSSALSQQLNSPSVSNQQLSSTSLTQQLTSQALSQQLNTPSVSSQLSNTTLSQQLNSSTLSQQLNTTLLSQQLSSSALSQQLNSSALSQQLSSPSLSQQLSTVSSQQPQQQYTVQTSQPSQHITLIQTSSSSSNQQQLPQLQIQIQQHQQNQQQQQQQQQQRPRVIIQNQQTGQATTFLHQISKSELEAQIQEHNQQLLLKQQLQQQQQRQQQQQQQTASLVNGVVLSPSPSPSTLAVTYSPAPSPLSQHQTQQLVNGDTVYSVGYQCNSSSSASTIDDVTREQTITALANGLKTSGEQHQLQTAGGAGLKLPSSGSPAPTLNFLQTSPCASPQLPQFRKVTIANNTLQQALTNSTLTLTNNSTLAIANNSRLPPSSSPAASPLYINLATSGTQPVRVIPSLASQLSKPGLGTNTGRIVTQGSPQQFTIIGSGNTIATMPTRQQRRLSANQDSSQSPKLVTHPVLSPSAATAIGNIVSFQTLSTGKL